MMNQPTLNLETQNPKSEAVECLGQTFTSAEARREHYLILMARKLKDSEFRKIAGKASTLKNKPQRSSVASNQGTALSPKLPLLQKMAGTIRHAWHNPPKGKSGIWLQNIGMEQHKIIVSQLVTPFATVENQASFLKKLVFAFDRFHLDLHVRTREIYCAPVGTGANYSGDRNVPPILIRYASRLAKNVAHRLARVCGLLLL